VQIIAVKFHDLLSIPLAAKFCVHFITEF